MKKEANIFDWYKKIVFENYANFTGRARRKEYWSFTLVNFLIVIVFYLMLFAIALPIRNDAFSGLALLPMILLFIYSLAVIVPSLAVTVRRLHDVGRSGWSLLLGLIPLVGPIILLVWYLTDSQPGMNRWGANPKDGNTQTFDFDNKNYNFNQ